MLNCSHPRAKSILGAVMRALRDGLDADEAAAIESSLPADLRSLWPRTSGAHPGLADLGDVGFLGRVQELAASQSGDRRAAWSALKHLPRESKLVWMKLFRAACFPVELYASDP
jgi:uncharacterized protein (DUF2267 family)